MEESVASEIAKGNVVWVLEPRGVTFFFNQYDIAPYASGMLTATILADEQPGFFREKYLRASAAYCEYLLQGYTADIVLHDGPDVMRDKLYVDCFDDMIHIGFKGQLISYDPTNGTGAVDIPSSVMYGGAEYERRAELSLHRLCKQRYGRARDSRLLA